MRVILDTNIFVSGIFFGGKPRKILNLIEEKTITPCFTTKTISELEAILNHEKFAPQRKLLPFTIGDFLTKLKTYSLIFPQPSKIPNIIKVDPADNHLLACALISGASFIVTGDKHLLSLKEFQGIFILPPKEFLKKMKFRKFRKK